MEHPALRPRPVDRAALPDRLGRGTAVTMAQPCWDNSTKRVEFPDIPGRSVNMVGPGELTNGAPARLRRERLRTARPARRVVPRPVRPHASTTCRAPASTCGRADVEAPALEKLVDGRGTADAPSTTSPSARLRFSYATWLTPSSPEGFSEIQAGYTITGADGWATQGLCEYMPGGTCPYASWTKEPGNVSVAYGQRVEFTDDVFTHLGAAGLELGDGTQDATVQRQRLHRHLRQRDGDRRRRQAATTDDADVTRGVPVTDNHLYALPREYHGGVAILNGYTQHT